MNLQKTCRRYYSENADIKNKNSNTWRFFGGLRYNLIHDIVDLYVYKCEK